MSLLFILQEKVDDERSDKDETDESEEEEMGGGDMKKCNGPVQNGHAVHNNNHSKIDWRCQDLGMWDGLISLSRGAGGRDEEREERRGQDIP